MTMFDAINTAGTGMAADHTWLDVISDNIANVNDETSPSGQVFRTHYVYAQSIGAGADGVGEGVAITGLPVDPANGTLEQDPTNPLADKQGYVRHTAVDLNEQMGDMIMAQRAYQANASVVDRSKDAYEAALDIGKGI